MKTKGIDYSQGLIWAAALVGMIRYAAAFLASDVGEIVGVTSDVITFLLGASGFFMGLLSTFGTAYLFDGWRQKMPASGAAWSFKFQVLTLFVFAAFLFELVILVPFTVSRMRHESITAVLNNGDWLWSFAVNIMPLLLIGGVSVGNKIVTVTTSEQPTNGSANDSPVANEKTNGSANDSQETNAQTNEKRTFKSLTNAERAYILSNDSKAASEKLGVTPRAVQKWRKDIEAENKSKSTPPFP